MKTILAVDDDQSLLNCYQAMLGRGRYQVFTAIKSADATRLIHKHKPDLIILDIHMPGKDGFEVFDEIKQEMADIPILFSTGYPRSFNAENSGMADRWERQFADGNTDIIYKPFDYSQLLGKVEALIGPGDDPPC